MSRRLLVMRTSDTRTHPHHENLNIPVRNLGNEYTLENFKLIIIGIIMNVARQYSYLIHCHGVCQNRFAAN